MSLEDRNAAIIEVIMQELGVDDIEELPAAVMALKRAAEQSVRLDECRCMRVPKKDGKFTIYRNPWCPEHRIRQ